MAAPTAEEFMQMMRAMAEQAQAAQTAAARQPTLASAVPIVGRPFRRLIWLALLSVCACECVQVIEVTKTAISAPFYTR